MTYEFVVALICLIVAILFLGTAIFSFKEYKESKDKGEGNVGLPLYEHIPADLVAGVICIVIFIGSLALFFNALMGNVPKLYIDENGKISIALPNHNPPESIEYMGETYIISTTEISAPAISE